MKLVRIPAGTFAMGSPKDEKNRVDDEEQHEVEITRPFFLGMILGEFSMAILWTALSALLQAPPPAFPWP